MIPLFKGGNAWSGIDDDSSALMSKDRREEALGVGAGQSICVGVADAR